MYLRLLVTVEMDQTFLNSISLTFVLSLEHIKYKVTSVSIILFESEIIFGDNCNNNMFEYFLLACLITDAYVNNNKKK